MSNFESQIKNFEGIFFLTMVIGGIGMMIYLAGANKGATKAMDEAISKGLAQHNPKTGAYEWLLPVAPSATSSQCEKPLDK